MADVLFLFLDGVGLAPATRDNPLAAASMPFLRRLLGGPLCAPLSGGDDRLVTRQIDANLGHPGLPQSATGQATLLTGRNCADLMGRHYGPWPGPTLRRLLDVDSLFHSARASGGRSLLANAYPPGYFQALQGGRARENVPVHAARSAGLELADAAAYAAGAAVPADLTGVHFTNLDPALPAYTPQQAGALLAGLAQGPRFTFFDFWLSDHLGHRGSFAEAVKLIETLDGFLEGVFGSLGDVTLLITSDHGNLEDKATRRHTRSPVPLLAAGPGRRAFAGCRSLVDVAPAVRRLWSPAG